MNKKGFAITGMLIILLVVVVGIMAFLFSSQLRFTIIGCGVILATFVYAIPAMMASKVTKNKIIVIVILIAAGVFIIFIPKIPFLEMDFSSTFTPRYCRDYEFTCCGETMDYTATKDVTDEIPYQCPSTATRCEILSLETENSYEWATGSDNCEMSEELLGDHWECDDRRMGEVGELEPGEYIWVLGSPNTWNTKGTIQVKVWEKRLGFCGSSGTVGQGISCGVAVTGADGCKYNPAGDYIYETTGQKKNVPGQYTVNLHDCILSWEGKRYICGNLEESCGVDADCTGYTYGNQECYARTLQTYGCTNFGEYDKPEISDLLAGIDSDFGKGENNDVVGGKRCDIVKTEQVQCCNSGDCGPGLYCDTQGTWTCVTQKSCDENRDCGVESTCDWVRKELVEPYCDKGECSEKRKAVDCCLDTNCPSGYYCDDDNKCKESKVDCNACTKECCIDECTGDGGYLDKPCPDGEYCVNNACTTQGCVNDDECEGEKICKDGQCVVVESTKSQCLTKNVGDSNRYQWVEKEEVSGWWIFKKTNDVSYCKDTWQIYYILGGAGIVLIIIVSIVVFGRKNVKKRK